MSEALAGKNRDTEQLVAQYVANPRPDLKDLIIVQCSTMVERIARRFSGVETFEDLVQVGYIGLLNALSKFDPSAGVRFNTYATHLVAGEIKHYLRDRSQIIRSPAWVQEMRHRLNRAAMALQVELGRQPTLREIAESCRVSEQSVEEVLSTQDLLKVTSLDAPVQDDDEDSDLDKLEASLTGGDQVSVEDRLVLEAAMRQLRDMEREVLVMFHFETLSQTEIASRLGISCNYVSHILRQSLSKLRRILDSEEQADRALRRHLPEQDEVMDDEIQAYTESYFLSRLTEELHRALASDGSVGVITVQFQGLGALQGFYGAGSVKDFMADAAEFLRSSVRGLDTVCRKGQEGFGIILPDTASRAELVYERIARRFDQWMVGRLGGSGCVQAAIGFAVAPDGGRSVSELLESASQAASGVRAAA